MNINYVTVSNGTGSGNSRMETMREEMYSRTNINVVDGTTLTEPLDGHVEIKATTPLGFNIWHFKRGRDYAVLWVHFGKQLNASVPIDLNLLKVNFKVPRPGIKLALLKVGVDPSQFNDIE